MRFTTSISRPLQLVLRFLQWSSAVIVMGLTSYLIHKGPRGEHLKYQEVIVRLTRPQYLPKDGIKANNQKKSVTSVVFFLPAFFSPFFPDVLSKIVLVIDVVFSYLYVSPHLPILHKSQSQF